MLLLFECWLELVITIANLSHPTLVAPKANPPWYQSGGDDPLTPTIWKWRPQRTETLRVCYYYSAEPGHLEYTTVISSFDRLETLRNQTLSWFMYNQYMNRRLLCLSNPAKKRQVCFEQCMLLDLPIHICEKGMQRFGKTMYLKLGNFSSTFDLWVGKLLEKYTCYCTKWEIYAHAAPPSSQNAQCCGNPPNTKLYEQRTKILSINVDFG